ncbi:hypothetical protein PO909_013432 [Leuciscus waleckii]
MQGGQELAQGAIRLLVLPVSNAHVERAFSLVSLLKDDTRNRMGLPLLSSIMDVRTGLSTLVSLGLVYGSRLESTLVSLGLVYSRLDVSFSGSRLESTLVSLGLVYSRLDGSRLRVSSRVDSTLVSLGLVYSRRKFLWVSSTVDVSFSGSRLESTLVSLGLVYSRLDVSFSGSRLRVSSRVDVPFKGSQEHIRS